MAPARERAHPAEGGEARTKRKEVAWREVHDARRLVQQDDAEGDEPSDAALSDGSPHQRNEPRHYGLAALDRGAAKTEWWMNSDNPVTSSSILISSSPRITERLAPSIRA
jgi:hypothetical protein